MSSLPTNWWIDPRDLPTSGVRPPRRREAPHVEWMRPDPRPRPTAPVRRPERPRPALRLADGMVELGERLVLYMAGFACGSTLVVLVNHLFGGS